MATALAPGFQGINFQTYHQWPQVSIDGLVYYQIPGRPGYVFDPYSGPNGTIKTDGRVVQDAIDSKKPQPPSTGQQVAQAAGGIAGTAGGIYLGQQAYNLANPGASTALGAATGAPAIASGAAPAVGGAAGAGAAAPSIISATNTGSTALGSAAGASAPLSQAGSVATPQMVSVGGAAPVEATTGLGQAAGYLGTALGVAGTLYGSYQVGKLYGQNKPGYSAAAGAGAGASAGGLIGSAVPGIGTLAGAGVGALVGGAIGGLLGTAKAGRHKDHSTRSGIRDALVQGGLAKRTTELGGDIPPEAVGNPTGTYLELADGSLYDISGERKNANYDVKDKAAPWSGMAVGWANPLAYLSENMIDPEGDLRGYMSGYFTNAITSNAGDDPEKIRANALALWNKMGIDQATAEGMLDEMVTNKRISQEEANAFKYGLGTMISGDQRGYVPGSVLDAEAARDGKTPEAKEEDEEEEDENLFKPQISGPTSVPNIQNVNTRSTPQMR